eukprot:Nk52_evm28s236 gene=Nk52_evmTU28s236
MARIEELDEDDLVRRSTSSRTSSRTKRSQQRDDPSRRSRGKNNMGVGDRPGKQSFEHEKYYLLACALILDLIGLASYLLPVYGELFDGIWAWVSGYLTYKWFGVGWGAILNTTEELLPFTDIVPGVLITWYWKYVINEDATRREWERNNQ